MNLESIFNPKSVAIIGASREPNKVGHAIVKNFIDSGFAGKIYPINPNAREIIGLKCYPSVSAVKGKIDCAIFAVPAKFVPSALRECGENGVKGAVIISGGFSEVGNVEGEKQIEEIARKYGIAVIGPNCLGVLNPSSRVDSVFLPVYKMGRPHVGGVSFMSQSGAVGGCILDLAARAGLGVSKFVSYGNASVIDETMLLEYLGNDEKTKIIVCYVEGVKRGREFLEAAKKVTVKKPVIMIKAGISVGGAAAAKSHTAALAGSSEAYKALFKQAKIIEAETLMELFYFSKIFDQPLPKGKRIGIMTNGGGYGVLAADAAEQTGLKLAELSSDTKKKLVEKLPNYVTVRNPLDLVGDADSKRYELALDALLEDENVDVIIVITLFQTVGLDSNVVNAIIKASDERKKPIIIVATGGEYTDVHCRILDSYGVPTYHSPNAAMKALKHAAGYAEYLERKEKRK
ncbi:CoA-binding protein [Candidatus Micrarchaeota archaeon]|nr:CoA-binding protein [Candidatus Micrarchaeota archaeon]